ncbi:MAG: hypothetical protein ACLFUZ_01100 [Candidatus Micrarchaeia archaeon]
MLRAPQENRPGPGGTPVKTQVSAEKLNQNTEKLLEGAAETLNSDLKSRMTTKEFFTLYNETMDRTLTAFENWGKAGRVKKLSQLEIENEILRRTSEKIGKAIGEALTRRIARSFINLKRRIGEAGVKEKLPEIMKELQDGQGDLKKLLNSKKIGLADDEIRVILDVREGGLSKADVEMINFASKNEIVHKFFRPPKPLPKGFMAKAGRGVKWTVNNLVCPEARTAVVRAYSAAATVRHPVDRAARDAMIEALGAEMDKRPGMTRHLRYKRYRVIPLAILLAAYVLSSSEEEKQLEGKKPSITASAKGRKERGPAEDILYKKAYIRHHRHKILDLMDEEGIPEEQRASAASVIATIPEDFFKEPELRKMVSVFNDLHPLSGKIPKEKIGMAVYNILRFVSPSQSNDFAKELAKEAKTAEDVDAFFENPPAEFTMTEAWLGKPFVSFVEAGFDRNDEKLKSLCSTIRRVRVKEGREEVPLSRENQTGIAGVLAEFYSSRGTPGIPENYQEDVEFLTRMLKKGFDVQTAGNILARARFVYKPKHFADAEEAIAPTLQPGMTREEMRLAIERHAFSKRGWAHDDWKNSTDSRLSEILTEGRTAQRISANLRQFPQHIYEEAVKSLVSFTNAWQSERRTLGNREITLLIPLLETITRSDQLSHLTPKQRGEVLYKIWTSVNLDKNKDNGLRKVLGFIKEKFEDREEPTVREIESSVDAYLEENPKLAL